MAQRMRHVFPMLAGGWVLSLVAGTTAIADEIPLENILVTGSRIARTSLESAYPIVTVDQTAFVQTATTSVERILNTYPQFVPNAGATTNSPSNDGQANVSLRGLGPNRTLVLVDGRRLMPADGNGVVDLNILPPALIRSVEVSTGGASTAYGSDAIAGVVNFRLADEFAGSDLQVSAAGTERGDGEEYSIDFTTGGRFGDGRGSVVAALGYAERKAVMQTDRSISKVPLRYLANERAFIPSGDGFNDVGTQVVFSDPSVFNQVFAGYGYPPDTVAWQPALGVNDDGTIFTIGTGEPGSVVNYRGYRDPVMFSDRGFATYNPAQYTAIQMPLDRMSAFVRARFDLAEALEVYGQVLYADYTVERLVAPPAIGIVLIPPTNPYIPADLATLLASRRPPDAPYRYFRRGSEVGRQTSQNDRAVLQITTGARGRLWSRWEFDAYAQFGENERSEYQTNDVSLSRLQDLTFAADAGASICDGGFNPYRPGSLSRDCADYIAFDAASKVTLRQTLAEVSASGVLGSLPTGDVSAAIGLFYRHEEFHYDADPMLSRMLPEVPDVLGPRPDVSGFAAAPDRAEDTRNVDVYAELRLPLLSSGRARPSLELGLGYRRSDHSEAGAVDAYKADLLWRPLDPVHLRGSFQRAVRAPSIEELYYPLIRDQFVIPRPDPCDRDSAARAGPDRAQVEALCLAQGLPPQLLDDYHYDLLLTDGVSGGNPDLDPEQADTVTVGIVLLPRSSQAWHAPQVSVDWYRIEIEKGISTWDSYSAVERCFDPGHNPGYDASNVYCRFFTRDSTTGEIFAEIVNQNIGGLETAGVDVEIDWDVDAGPGRFGLNVLGTYVDQWTYLDPSGGAVEYAGTVGGSALGRSLPRWKSLVTLSYTLGAAQFQLRTQHLDDTRDVAVRDFEVPAYDYFDVGASYAFQEGALRGLELRAGVENLTDETAPIFPSWQQDNTDPAQFDVLGRRYYLRLKYALH